MKEITSLADYAAIKKLASALWQQNTSYHGAAIMVGAGFSRSAASTGDINKKMPVWKDFLNILAGDLDSGSTDSLRLAEEYCAYFGRQALYDLIKKEINDSAWLPGELHKFLLELPWSEILTTNWDTLLERASAEIHDPIYSLVYKQEDLSSARAPRIVKLHGTIDITKDLIFTQEDYRKYPQENAAFVNFSRQVFIENELCLLGFSGDDPNFLQWAGWVRDQLASQSRRIYLVGVLGLNAAKRKYLESINVAPIDLSDLVADYDDQNFKHLEATRSFIKALQDLKPKPIWDWEPTRLGSASIANEERAIAYQESHHAVRALEGNIPSLEQDRISYPDWLVCPYGKRFSLQSHISNPWPTPKIISAMEGGAKARLLYEIAWHHKLTFEVIPSWLVNELIAICGSDESCVLSQKQKLEIAVVLLKNTLWMEDSEAKNVSRVVSSILEVGSAVWPESHDELAYYNAIVARDKFDYAALEMWVEKITSVNPVWKLRKASLLAELGQFAKGEVLVSEAYKKLLDQHKNDRNSIHVLSRLAWAHWLIRGVDLSSHDKEFKAFPSYYRDAQCDPWDHIEHLRDRVSKELDKQQKQKAIEPSFEPGRYKDNSNRVSFSNEVHPLLLHEGISNTVGMPLSWDNVGFLAEQAARLAELDGIDNVHRFALAVRSANSDSSDVLKKTFSRVRVACFSEDDVDFLLRQCESAISYWAAKWMKTSGSDKLYVLGRLRVFIEIMARVSVRAAPEKAKHVFRLSVSLSRKPELHHFWLFDTLGRLSSFSLESIPDHEQCDILLDALLFPLLTEINAEDINWGNPVVRHPGVRIQDSALSRRIDEIIDSIAPCSPKSASALLRLIPLIEKNFLTAEERQKISRKIWGDVSELSVLPETGLLKYTLLKFPSPDPSAVKSLVRNYLFERKDLSLLNLEVLADIANATQAEGVREFPSAEQAIDCFERLVVWRPNTDAEDILRLSRNTDRQIAESIGKVLARSVIPSLSSEHMSEERFQELYRFYSDVEVPEALIAFPYFAIANKTFVEPTERLIRQGLQSNNGNHLAFASSALLNWRKCENLPEIDRLIARLVYLVSSNQTEGLSAIIWTVNQMYCMEYLPEESVESLVDTVPVIFDNARYRDFYMADRVAVNISFVRAACASFAKSIVLNGKCQYPELLRVIDEAEKDSLPEVRFFDSRYRVL